ncbi:hypothetical protein BDZ89DRAFT_1068283 [Hymenopellis radicata]|nr:hypothetical protein BDZ89DRAFT_1068283 [Hymenopellis radicata]
MTVPQCHRVFTSSTTLHSHCSAKADHISCDACECLFPDDAALRQHLSPVHQNDSSEAHCNRSFGNDAAQKQHQKYAAIQDATSCESCNRPFAHRKALYQHLSASSAHHWCFGCSTDFPSPQSLSQHNSSHVDPAADIKCPLCARLFELPSDIASHLRTTSCDSRANRQDHASSISVGRSIQEPSSRATDVAEGKITNLPSPSVVSNEHDHLHAYQSKYSFGKSSADLLWDFSDEDDHGRVTQAELVMNILTEHGIDFDVDVDDLSKEMFMALQMAIDESLATHIQNQEEAPQRGRRTSTQRLGASSVPERVYAEFPANDPPGPIYRAMPVQCQTPLIPIPNNAFVHDIIELDEYESDDDETYCQLCDRSWVLKAAFYQHLRVNPAHNWCFECSKDFATPQSLFQHNASPVHTAALKCPRFFKAPSDTATHDVAAEVPAPKFHPTIPPSPRRSPTPANVTTTSFVTKLALNRRTGKYECYLCHRGFGALFSLKAHLASPAHDAKEFKCPHYSCGQQFPVISALIQHIEHEGCGLARFRTQCRE